MENADADFQRLLDEAVKFHGHLCGGQVIGVRMAMAGLRELGIKEPRGKEGRDLVIFVEIDRCATDAIISVTGRTPGKRSLKMLDYGKMAATFVNVGTGKAVRICVRADLDEKVRRIARANETGEGEEAAYLAALAAMPEDEVLKIGRVIVNIRPRDLPGKPLSSVICERCGEAVRDMREVYRWGRILCRPCADRQTYYALEDVSPATGASRTSRGRVRKGNA